MQTSVHYPPAHRFEIYAGAGADLPLTDAYAARAVTLPLFAHMTEQQVELVVVRARGSRRVSAPAAPGRRAVILAGGKGTRLGPFTTILPKPLLPVGDRAIVEIIIHQLRERGFTRLTLAVGYLSHLISAVLGDGAAYGVSLDYHLEHVPLGTAGALAGIDGLDETFLMMNGDVITTLDYGALLRAHELSGNALTVAVQARTATIDFGVLELDGGDGSTQAVVGYHEKPQRDYIVSMGDLRARAVLARPHRGRCPPRLPRPRAPRAGRRRARRRVPLRRALARHRTPRRLRARDRAVLGRRRLARPGRLSAAPGPPGTPGGSLSVPSLRAQKGPRQGWEKTTRNLSESQVFSSVGWISHSDVRGDGTYGATYRRTGAWTRSARQSSSRFPPCLSADRHPRRGRGD